MPTRPVVTVYTRRGCHLCADAVAIVHEVAAGRAEVALVDIDADPDITDRYTVRVPVVAVDGVEVAEYQVAREQLEAALGAAPAAGERGGPHPPRRRLRLPWRR